MPDPSEARIAAQWYLVQHYAPTDRREANPLRSFVVRGTSHGDALGQVPDHPREWVSNVMPVEMLAAADVVQASEVPDGEVCYVIAGSTDGATPEEVRPTIRCLGEPDVVAAVQAAVEKGKSAASEAEQLRTALQFLVDGCEYEHVYYRRIDNARAVLAGSESPTSAPDEPMVEIGGQRMTQAQYDAATFPFTPEGKAIAEWSEAESPTNPDATRAALVEEMAARVDPESFFGPAVGASVDVEDETP